MSRKFVPRIPIDNTSSLVQLMPWHLTGDKLSLRPITTQFSDAHKHASPGLNTLRMSDFINPLLMITLRLRSVGYENVISCYTAGSLRWRSSVRIKQLPFRLVIKGSVNRVYFICFLILLVLRIVFVKKNFHIKWAIATITVYDEDCGLRWQISWSLEATRLRFKISLKRYDEIVLT